MMKRILGNIAVSATILEISPVTLYRLGTCLYMINRVSFVSVSVYQKFARAAFASLACDLGNFGNFTGNTHALLVHGDSFIAWAQEEVGVPLGWLTEGALEFGNKLNLAYRALFSFKGNLKKETEQIFRRRLEISDPKLCIDGVESQELREGYVREYRRSVKEKVKGEEVKERRTKEESPNSSSSSASSSYSSASSSSSAPFPSFRFYSTTTTVYCPSTPGGKLAARWRELEAASWPRPRLDGSSRDYRYMVEER